MAAAFAERPASEAASRFEQRFGRRPEWVVAAPGRVNLIGDHTDHNGGFVLPMCIERQTVIAAGRGREAAPAGIVAKSVNLDDEDAFALDRAGLRPTGRWTDYIRGVLAGFVDRGLAPRPLDLVVSSDVPVGCGLSSSAALQVAMAELLYGLDPAAVGRDEIPALCQAAEQAFAGVPVGIMDPFCIANARENHALLLDCQAIEATHVPFLDANVAVLILDSGIRRELRSGAYAERRRQCKDACRILGISELRDVSGDPVEQARDALGDIAYRRARHVTSENARTLAAADAMQSGSWSRFGELMYQSHRSLRDDFDVSCPEIDTLVGLAERAGTARGVFGARITGGGFGGSVVALIKSAKAGELTDELSAGYREATGKTLSAYVSSPAAGARVLDESEWRSP